MRKYFKNQDRLLKQKAPVKVFEHKADQREPELMRLPIMQAQRHSTTSDILNPEKDKKTSLMNNSMRRRLFAPNSNLS